MGTSVGGAAKRRHYACQGFARIERGEVLVSFLQVNKASNVQAKPAELLDKVSIAPKLEKRACGGGKWAIWIAGFLGRLLAGVDGIVVADGQG